MAHSSSFCSFVMECLFAKIFELHLRLSTCSLIITLTVAHLFYIADSFYVPCVMFRIKLQR